ncbi:MAG: hypothetical protein EOS41_24795 [Mesorhizobium sp.]|nr:MAG: hypothetical protein EOS41_24795 [Mesorhizobium sp.]
MLVDALLKLHKFRIRNGVERDIDMCRLGNDQPRTGRLLYEAPALMLGREFDQRLIDELEERIGRHGGFGSTDRPGSLHKGHGQVASVVQVLLLGRCPSWIVQRFVGVTALREKTRPDRQAEYSKAAFFEGGAKVVADQLSGKAQIVVLSLDVG